jgi:hypothetical protein
MDDDGTLHIQSFRQCFQLERRIHRLDRWRLPMPYGLPVRGIAYCAGLLLAVLILGRLPVLGAFLGSMHPAIRLVVVPIAGAYALMTLRIDGRAAHIVGIAWLRMRCEPTRIVAFRGTPARAVHTLGTITLAPDERSPRLRPGVVEGHGRIVLRYPVDLKQRGRRLDVRQTGTAPRWRGTQIDLDLGQRVCVR